MNRSWKTTTIGCILAVMVAVQPIIETGTVNWKQAIFAGGIALLSYFMKDADKTGLPNG